MPTIGRARDDMTAWDRFYFLTDDVTPGAETVFDTAIDSARNQEQDSTNRRSE
jgi:hypothetical protein